MVHFLKLPEAQKLTPRGPSIFAAFRQLLPVLIKQLRYENALLIPPLPKGATEYGPEVERLRPFAV